jgi:3-dehydroquinate synthase
MLLKGNLILIGMPGSGKTTFGKFVAKKLGVPFLDTDTLIEETTGKRIEDIFYLEGEKAFRLVEKEIVRKASMTRKAVIATGGGAWLNPESRKSLQESGTVIYLACEPEEIWNRLQNSPQTRPLLKKGFGSLKELFDKRHREYRVADYILDTTGKSLEDEWDEISRELGIGQKSDRISLTEAKLTVSTPYKLYTVAIGCGVIYSIGSYLEEKYCAQDDGNRPRIFLVTNPFVNAICGENVLKTLNCSGFKTSCFVIPEGEQYKTLDWARKAYSRLAVEGFDRGDVVLALGGGVIGDLAGFVAATYMRGMSLVQVPTTLLAQVDSSIGGKTAVNLPEGKNMVGAFHQPDFVVTDLSLLQHLPQYHYRQGLAECVKYGIIGDRDLFELFENSIDEIQSRNIEKLKEIVVRCCQIKGRIVSADERENNLRMVLNLGHTVGHALEATIGYGRIGHGDAVALGMRANAFLSTRLGMLSMESRERIEKLLDRLGFPERAKFSTIQAIEYLERDKKKNRGEIRFVLPWEIGRVDITGKVDYYLLEEALCFIGGQ